jgi:hypothetical protein
MRRRTECQERPKLLFIGVFQEMVAGYYELQ